MVGGKGFKTGLEGQQREGQEGADQQPRRQAASKARWEAGPSSPAGRKKAFS